MTLDTKLPDIKVGMLVLTADGAQLGRIKTLSTTCAELDIFLGPDYWIGRDLVKDTATGVAVLRENRNFFNQRVRRGRTHEGLHANKFKEQKQ